MYGGRLVLGGKQGQRPVTQAQSLAAVPVQVIAPFATLKELQTTTSVCVKDTTVQQRLVAQLDDTSHLAEFVNELRKLSKAQIPPACAADLSAVAEALQQK